MRTNVEITEHVVALWVDSLALAAHSAAAASLTHHLVDGAVSVEASFVSVCHIVLLFA